MSTNTIQKYSQSNLSIKAILLLLVKDQNSPRKDNVKEIGCRCQQELTLHQMMIRSDAEMPATEVARDISLSEAEVKLLVDDLKAPRFGNKKKPKNGEVDVTFFKQGFDMLATIFDKNGTETKWRYHVKKLPSEIDIKKSSSAWKVDTGMVVIRLFKKEEISWQAMLRSGLEQSTDSSSDDEGVGIQDLNLRT